MSERDAFIDQMDREKGCGKPRGLGVCEPYIDPLNEALYRTWQHVEAARVAEEASQRLARNSWSDLKRTAKAMGVELL